MSTGNLLLDALPPYIIEPLVETVDLDRGDHVDLHDVWFPGDCVVVLRQTHEDANAAVLVGREGFIDPVMFNGSRPVPLGRSCEVLVPGCLLQMQYHDFRELVSKTSEDANDLFARYVMSMYDRMMWEALCAHHTVDERVARMLLSIHERIPGDVFHITHRTIAGLLNVRRASVTVAINLLRAVGGLLTDHATLTVGDPRLIEEVACACEHNITSVYNTVLPEVAAFGAEGHEPHDAD